MRRLIFQILVSLLAIASFAQTSLRPGQRLRFTCPTEPLLDVSRIISPDGAILLPFLGSVGVAGKTLDRVQVSVIEMLQARGRYAPVQVRLAFDPNAEITFEGTVDLPGSLPPFPPKSLKDILAVAQPGKLADLHAIEITDALGKTFKVDATLAEEVPVRAGDHVKIPLGAEAYEAIVLGGVVRPGNVPLQEGLTVAKAIEEAGGLSGHGDVNQITVEHLGVSTAATLQTILFKGDIVRVGLSLDRRFVAIKGAVLRQGVVEWRKGMLLTEIVREAGGEVPGADLAHIEVRRFTSGRSTRFDLGLIRKQVAKDPIIEANDTIIVPFGGQL